MDSGPQYRFDAFSTVHTKTFEKDRIARCDVRLQTHAPVHMTSSFFWLDRFRAFTLIRYVSVFVLIHFPERLHIDEFAMKTLSVLVWTEDLNASKCVRFNRKRMKMDGTWISRFSCLDCLSRWIYGNGLLPIALIVSATPVFLQTVVLVEHRHC